MTLPGLMEPFPVEWERQVHSQARSQWLQGPRRKPR